MVLGNCKLDLLLDMDIFFWFNKMCEVSVDWKEDVCLNKICIIDRFIF